MGVKLFSLVVAMGVIGFTIGVTVAKFQARRLTPSKYLARKELE